MPISSKTEDKIADINLFSFHEGRAGRLIVDPHEAKVELGDEISSRLKLSKDGTKVLWPQPTDDPEDPQNWSDRRKAFQLFIITVTSVVPDFNTAIGWCSRTLFLHLTNFLGWGGLFAVMLMRRYGRLPILFWSQLLALAFLIGATFAPNLSTFAAMRCLTGFFGTVPQVTGLFVVTDMFPFHLQARKLNIWTMGFIVSPFLSPFAFGFLVAHTSWRWAYAIGSLYDLCIVILIFFFMEETMYDRTVEPIPPKPTTGLRYRFETLVGITGVKMAQYRASWGEVALAPLRVVWRPQLLGILVFEAVIFGFGIGINVTNVVFLGSPPFNYSQSAIAGMYGTPIVSVIMGELIGRYLNDWIMNVSVRRNNGVFEAQHRLWACYPAVALNTCGFLVLGAAFQKQLSIGAIIMGWGIAEVGIMIDAYCNDCFPKNQGEISALITLSRILGGFSVAYFQVPWAEKRGAMEAFGVEAAIVIGIFLCVVPFLQIRGTHLRVNFKEALSLCLIPNIYHHS
ncbi:MFS general substrate transporter [Infundibulicybe gibba]|nr:MFS general substrate transporter [Infundibulicybe gibba]